MYRNEVLHIAGKPHGVDKTGGAMIPVTAFSGEGLLEDRPHKLTWQDRWNLAFSWLLLSPYRTAQVSPRAHTVAVWEDWDRPRKQQTQAKELILPLEADVPIVESVIEQVRRAKASVSPWQCGVCDVCRGHDEHAHKVAP